MNLKKEKCKVISIASRVKSILRLNLSNQILINNEEALACPYIHLYILSDEKINEGDWCMCDDRMSIYEDPKYFVGKCKSIFNGWIHVIDGQGENPDWTKKIIASTDKNLNLPEPSPQFVEKYVEEYNKRNFIDNVDVLFQTDWNPETIMCMEGYGDNPDKHPYVPKPKVDKNNYITITKIKDSWSKDELTQIIHDYREFAWKKGLTLQECDKWIMENL